MSETSGIFFVPFGVEHYGSESERLSLPDRVHALKVQRHFKKIGQAAVEKPIVLYPPVTPAEKFAKIIGHGLKDPTLLPSDRIFEAGNDPRAVQWMDEWIRDSIESQLGHGRPDDTPVIAVASERLVEHVAGNTFSWLYQETLPLRDVVEYEPKTWDPAAYVPEVEMAATGDHNLSILRSNEPAIMYRKQAESLVSMPEEILRPAPELVSV